MIHRREERRQAGECKCYFGSRQRPEIIYPRSRSRSFLGSLWSLVAEHHHKIMRREMGGALVVPVTLWPQNESHARTSSDSHARAREHTATKAREGRAPFRGSSQSLSTLRSAAHLFALQSNVRESEREARFRCCSSISTHQGKREEWTARTATAPLLCVVGLRLNRAAHDFLLLLSRAT